MTASERTKVIATVPERGVHSLDHFTIEVPDLDEAERFYRAFGLDVERRDDRLDLRTHGTSHVWQRVVAGARKRLLHICFGIYAEDVPYFRERLALAGVTLGAPLPHAADPTSETLWFSDPHGMGIALRVTEKISPDAKDMTASPRASAGQRGAAMREAIASVRPRRLAHALFFTPAMDATIAFYTSSLGLRLSDHPGPVAFLHGIHGSDHHMIAFAQSDLGIGYHHAAWDVAHLDEVGLGGMQMAEAGYAKGNWGFGRHVLGSNYFNYIRDPWDSYSEYSFDIDYIPKGISWQTGYPHPDNSFYLWGPDAPDDFAYNYEAMRLSGDAEPNSNP